MTFESSYSPCNTEFSYIIDSMSGDMADDSSNASSTLEGDGAPPPSRTAAAAGAQATPQAPPLPAAAAALGMDGGGGQNQATMLLNLLTQMWLIQQKAAQVQLANQQTQQEQKTLPTGPTINVSNSE